MATLSVIKTNRTPGINYTTQAVPASAGGDKFQNTGQQVFFINNGGGSAITVTEVFGVQALIDSIAPANRTVTVPAGQMISLGPFPPTTWNDGTGYMNLQYSGVANVSVLVQQVGS